MERQNKQRISEEEVITKLKDDGDFDRIRLNIEELRNNIISAVKESAALNHASAENMTPRQLCDAIHDEISENVMVQISDGLWKIIRSDESIKTEITETVKSVYDKLLKPEGPSPIAIGENQVGKVAHFNGLETAYDGGCKETPGFPLQNHSNHLRSEEPGVDPNNGKLVEQRRKSRWSDALLQPEDGDTSPPPGFMLHGKHKRASDGIDEDPDIPPGFG